MRVSFKTGTFVTSGIKSAASDIAATDTDMILVAEITASAEVINTVIPWDGEVDPICFVYGQLTGVDGQSPETGFRLNGDSGNNYPRGNIYQDGGAILAALFTPSWMSPFKRASTGISSISARATFFLQNVGARSRSFESTMLHYSDDNSDRHCEPVCGYWTNDVDPVTSMTVLSSGQVTGYVRLYKPVTAEPADFWDTFTGDDFTGTNGDSLNWVAWEDQAQEYEILIQSNKANADIITGSDDRATSIATFGFSGDFNIQIDVDTAAFTNLGWLRLYVFNAAVTYGGYIGFHYDAGHKFHGTFMVNTSWDISTQVARANDYGGLRITRTGTTLYIDYKDGAGSFTNLVSQTVNADDYYPRLQISSGSGAGDRASGNFDNFVINSGTVVPSVVKYGI